MSSVVEFFGRNFSIYHTIKNECSPRFATKRTRLLVAQQFLACFYLLRLLSLWLAKLTKNPWYIHHDSLMKLMGSYPSIDVYLVTAMFLLSTCLLLSLRLYYVLFHRSQWWALVLQLVSHNVDDFLKENRTKLVNFQEMLFKQESVLGSVRLMLVAAYNFCRYASFWDGTPVRFARPLTCLPFEHKPIRTQLIAIWFFWEGVQVFIWITSSKFDQRKYFVFLISYHLGRSSLPPPGGITLGRVSQLDDESVHLGGSALPVNHGNVASPLRGAGIVQQHCNLLHPQVFVRPPQPTTCGPMSSAGSLRASVVLVGVANVSHLPGRASQPGAHVTSSRPTSVKPHDDILRLLLDAFQSYGHHLLAARAFPVVRRAATVGGIAHVAIRGHHLHGGHHVPVHHPSARLGPIFCAPTIPPGRCVDDEGESTLDDLPRAHSHLPPTHRRECQGRRCDQQA